jgi:RNA polymerase sigma-70 factor (ECF subfamily)
MDGRRNQFGFAVARGGRAVSALRSRATTAKRRFTPMTLVEQGAQALSNRASMSACIVAIAASADRNAFAVLFAHFAPRIKTYLLRHGAGSGMAEDVTQDTMLAVWRKARLFDPAKADAVAWIFTIARNMRIDALRRERHPELPPDDPMLVRENEPAGDDRMEADERARRISRAIAELPADQQDVVRLSYYEDKPHREIEADLGIPLGTVKSRLRLALIRLRAAVGEDI